MGKSTFCSHVFKIKVVTELLHRNFGLFRGNFVKLQNIRMVAVAQGVRHTI